MVYCAWKSPSPKISPEISPVWTRKRPSVFAALRKISPISPISPGCRGCFFLRVHSATRNPRNPQNIHASSTPQTRMIARFPENIHEIHEIHEIHWMPWMRGFPAGGSCAQRCERKAHLVTFCHRLWECPFFRVFEGEMHFIGFPFGWRRDAPKRAFFGPSHRGHQIDQCGAHAMVSCAWNPGFRRESHSTSEHKSRIILSWSQRRLFPRF